MAPPEPPSPITIETFGAPEPEAGLGGAGDGLGLAAFLRVDAGPGAGGVDEGDHGQREAVGELHQADRLAVALGLGHAEIVADAGLGVVTLLLAEDRDRTTAEAAETREHGGVLAEGAVAGERGPFLDEGADVVDRVGTVRMAGDLRLLPGRQLGVEIHQRLGGLGLQLGDVVGDGDGVTRLRQRLQLLDLAVQVGHRLFELEVASHPLLCEGAGRAGLRPSGTLAVEGPGRWRRTLAAVGAPVNGDRGKSKAEGSASRASG